MRLFSGSSLFLSYAWKSSALQALLHSIVPETSAIGQDLTPESRQKLSAKLSELVGEDVATEFLQSGSKAAEVRLPL